jgi:hypothetical protein
MRLCMAGPFVVLLAVIAGLAPSPASGAVRASISWTTASNVHLHAFDKAGNHAFFANPTAIPNARIAADSGAKTASFTELSGAPRDLRLGACYFSDFSGQPANPTTVTVQFSNAAGAPTTQTITLAKPGNRALLGSSTVPAPPAGWCARPEDPPTSGRALKLKGNTTKTGSSLICESDWYGHTNYTTQWLRDSRPISGATATTYVVKRTDKGHSIACRSTASNANGRTTATSGNRSAESGGDDMPAGESDGPCTEQSIPRGVVNATGCFTARNGVFRATGAITLNGFTLRPKGGAIEIDTKDLTLRTTSGVTASIGAITLFSGKIPSWNLKAEYSHSVPSGARLHGMPLAGTIEAKLKTGGATLHANATIPKIGGLKAAVTGDVKIEVDAGKVKLDMSITNLVIGAFTIKQASLGYARTAEGDEWKGSVEAALPVAGGKVVKGTLRIVSGGLRGADLSACCFNIAISAPPIAYLQKIGLGISFQPLRFKGDISVSAGPLIPAVNVAAVALDGSLSAEFDKRTTLTVSGDMLVGGVKLAHGEIVYKVPSEVRLSVDMDQTRGPFSAVGKINGHVDEVSFRLHGYVQLGAKVSFVGRDFGVSVRGEGLVSNVGVAACGSGSISVPFKTFRYEIGWGYKWGGSADVTGSCNIGAYEPARSTRQAGGPMTILVPAGQRQIVLGATGDTASPNVDFVAPDGTVFSMTSSATSGEQGRMGYVILPSPDVRRSYLLVMDPKPGRWTVRQREGAGTITNVGSARELPEPRVKASIKRVGRRARLRWSFTGAPARQVRFIERTDSGQRQIIVTKRSKGTKTFSPMASTKGKRSIVAFVETNGVPESEAAVATFTARVPSRPGRSRLMVRKRGSRGLISWTPAARAASYVVRVTVTDGRRLAFRTGPRSRRVTVPDLDHGARFTVSVQATDTLGRSGPTTTRRLSRR